ncbi:MAG: OsmC family protein [Halioglobus sp.]
MNISTVTTNNTETINEASSVTSTASVNMSERQAPLYELYAKNPAAAWIEDYAITTSARTPASNPLRADLDFKQTRDTHLPVGVHKAVGGDGDFPCPGEILCGALAACLDSSIRIIANRLGVTLLALEVEVRGNADVRGTLRADDACPVAFQSLKTHVNIEAAPEVDEVLIKQLLKAAEYSCVIMQTLRSVPETPLTATINRENEFRLAH